MYTESAGYVSSVRSWVRVGDEMYRLKLRGVGSSRLEALRCALGLLGLSRSGALGVRAGKKPVPRIDQWGHLNPLRRCVLASGGTGRAHRESSVNGVFLGGMMRRWSASPNKRLSNPSPNQRPAWYIYASVIRLVFVPWWWRRQSGCRAEPM